MADETSTPDEQPEDQAADAPDTGDTEETTEQSEEDKAEAEAIYNQRNVSDRGN